MAEEVFWSSNPNHEHTVEILHCCWDDLLLSGQPFCHAENCQAVDWSWLQEPERAMQLSYKEDIRKAAEEKERLATREREKEEAGRKKAAEVKTEKWKRAR